ncbi:MAG: hypothetical protein EBX30_08970 [Betaproteobacteria bacterium]|nr:hypothetical protein [Betaproteobacteria bacterium]NCY07312.1 hypothetical protein [Betaproteobacteria bacterium]
MTGAFTDCVKGTRHLLFAFNLVHIPSIHSLQCCIALLRVLAHHHLSNAIRSVTLCGALDLAVV